MSNNVKEEITVKNVTKYGLYDTKDVGYYLGQKSGLKPDSFEKGNTYQVLVWTSDGGKKYINQIVGEQATPPATKAPAVEGNKEAYPGDYNTLDKPVKKEVDWDKKTLQIQAQGCIQAAVQSPGLQLLLITNYEDYWKNVERLAKDMLEFVKRNS